MKDLQQMQAKLENQKGFTLVEIAIVLVIIGLLLGGVLKGQELIENTKLKAVKTDADGISAAILGYQDRFRSLPGDDIDADAHTGAAVTEGNGDGSISTTEGVQAWEHLRLTGFMSGSGTDAPINSFGGDITIFSATGGLVICQKGLDQTQMRLVDSRYDDGTGSDDTGATKGAIYYVAQGGTALTTPFAVAAGELCIQY